MCLVGEQPPKQRTPEPAEEPVRRAAHAFGETRINQAGRDLHLRHRDGVRGATSGYDAFISYSHALDGAVAQALQTGLERDR